VLACYLVWKGENWCQLVAPLSKERKIGVEEVQNGGDRPKTWSSLEEREDWVLRRQELGSPSGCEKHGFWPSVLESGWILMLGETGLEIGEPGSEIGEPGSEIWGIWMVVVWESEEE